LLFAHDLGHRDVERSVNVDLEASKLYIQFKRRLALKLRSSQACEDFDDGSRNDDVVSFCLPILRCLFRMWAF
jgi:hypothetical protein